MGYFINLQKKNLKIEIDERIIGGDLRVFIDDIEIPKRKDDTSKEFYPIVKDGKEERLYFSFDNFIFLPTNLKAKIDDEEIYIRKLTIRDYLYSALPTLIFTPSCFNNFV